MTKTNRLMELMMVVYEKKRFTVDELANEFGVSYRTMLRYLQELSGMGVPLYSEVGKHGGYSILNQKDSRRATAPSSPLIRSLFRPSSFVIGIEFKAPFTAVYMANAVIPKLWAEMHTRKHEIDFPIDENRMIGVVQNRNLAYHYIAGVEVTSSKNIPNGMIGIILPAKAYAVYTHQGAYQREERDETYFHALEKLRQQSRDHDPNAFCLELFNPGSTPNTCMEYEIYIPLK